MDVQTIECQLCGKRFSPRIGEQFCSPGHARDFFANAARARDRRKTDAKPNSTARHRVMQLLRLPEPDIIPPQARLVHVDYRPTAVIVDHSAPVPVIDLTPIQPQQSFVLQLPVRMPVAMGSPDGQRPDAERLDVAQGLQALVQAFDGAGQVASSEKLLPIGMPPASGISGNDVWCKREIPFEAEPVSSRQPILPNSPDKYRIVDLHLAATVAWYTPRPQMAGARIITQKPLSMPSMATAALNPPREVPGLWWHSSFDCNIIFPLEPFRKNLLPELPPASVGTAKVGTKTGEHAQSLRWEFLHELEEDPTRLQQHNSKAVKPQSGGIHRESVEAWLIPQRPSHPAWQGDLRPFDWAQLIARLADFETSGSHRVMGEGTGRHGSTTRQAAVQLRKRTIPVIGPLLYFWGNQTWLVRGLILAIPALAFIAVKPSLDGSLREPAVLAKAMPPPSSTVVRREPARERQVVMQASPLPMIPVSQQPPVTMAAPVVVPPAEKPVVVPQPQPQTAAPGSRVVEPPKHHPTLVAEPGIQSKKPAQQFPVAKVEPKLNNFDRVLLTRAAVELADDFSYGLDSWESRSNAVQWTYDRTGFIRPRGLALYRPSMNLNDYSVEFLAKIDSSAISWVVRAQDLNNYHVIKLIQRGGGPLPRYAVMRYVVVNGREGPRVEHPLPLNLYKDTLFRIRMNIRGSDFAILVQDSVVDSWSDDRFPTGGVGFFSGLGEEARIRWVQVTYQNDFLGKICAWLAPKAS